VLAASIGFVGFGLAVLKQPYEPRITILLASTTATLLAAAMRARFARIPGSRFWWFEFSRFGWTHLLFVGSVPKAKEIGHAR
jgi:hypothetical protein